MHEVTSASGSTHPAYTTLDINWPYKGSSASGLFNIPLVMLHVFRMPIFLALAGFFARFSWQRSGTQAFHRNRARRILVQFVVGWPILFVICSLGYSYANSFSSHAIS